MISVLRHSCARAALMSAATFAMAGPALAQDEAAQAGVEDAVERDTIVITGSFIRGTPEDAALPVDVFSSEDLAQSGTTSPLEFIKELPSVGAVLGDTNQFSTTSQGFQGSGSINLRGLGFTRTLVLLNGKRTIQSPGDGFSDTNLIPLFALDRVEILKDGAAATYGSDAIAGVANFVTRQNFEGLELQGDWTFIDGSDGNYRISALYGGQFGDLNILAGAGWQHRSELATTERDFTIRSLGENPSAYSALATPGLYAVTYLGAEGLDTRVVPEAGCADVGGTQTGAICRFSFIPFDNIVEDEDRYQAFIQADVDLSDSTRFHAEALYAKTDLESLNYSPSFPPTQGPRGSGFQGAFTTSPNNPFVADFLDQNGLPQSGGTAGTLVAVTNLFYRPLGWLGNPLDPERGSGRGIAKNEGWRMTGGFELDVSEKLTANLNATYWRSERLFTVPDIVGTRFQNALNGLGGADCNPATGTPGAGGCSYFNPFISAGPRNPAQNLDNPLYIPGNENSEDLLNFLIQQNGSFQTEEQYILDAVIAGETGLELGGGALAFAVGAQYRENEYTLRSNNAISDLDQNPCFIEGDRSCVGTSTDGVGPFIFLGGTRDTKLDQSVYAVFAEVNAPLLDNLEVSGAIRYEDYGGSIGSTINPKGSFRYEPLEWLTLRGSVGTTFRGPLASDVTPNGVTTLAGLDAAGGNFKSVDIFGNPNDLQPETAFTYNIGAILNHSGFTFSVDYWSFDFKDRITTTPAQAIASEVANGQTSGALPVNCSSPLANLVTFSGDTCVQGTTNGIDIARIRTDIVNGPDVKISGIDFALDYTFDLGPGTFSAGGNATWNREYEFDAFELQGVTVQEAYDAVGFANHFRDPQAVPEWRINAYVNYNVAGLNLRYTMNYIDSVFDDRCIDVDPCAVDPLGNPVNFGRTSGSFTQHNLNAIYDFSLASIDLQLQGSVSNIFDTDPADARLPISFNPFVGNALGRTYRLGLKANF